MPETSEDGPDRPSSSFAPDAAPGGEASPLEGSTPLSAEAHRAPAGDAAGSDAIDEASTPAFAEPWSRPASPRPMELELRVQAAPPPPAQRPYGWEWSRGASTGISRPSLFPEEEIGEAAAGHSSTAAVRAVEAPASRLGLDLLALSMALLGGLLALAGAFFQELQSGVGVFLLVLAAPVIEEVLKPSGIYLLLVKWPQALRGQLHTALLCAISGAVFGILESLIYVELYYPDGSDAFVLFRFTVTPIMHATASFIVGYGLSQGLVDWANGKSRLSKRTRTCYLLGIGLHASYNASVLILGGLGVLDFLKTAVLR